MTDLQHDDIGADNMIRDHSATTNSYVPSANLFVKLDKSTSFGSVSERPSISYWQDARTRLLKNKVALVAGIYIVLMAMAALIVPELIEFSYDEQEVWNKHRPPTLGEEAVVAEPASLTYAPITAPEPAAAASGDTTAADASMVVDPPPAPANLRLMSEALTTGVALTWDFVPGADGYRIYRSITEDSLGVPIEELSANQLSFLDISNLTPDTLYYFVVAFNSFGDSFSPARLEATPKLALTLAQAVKLEPSAKVGDRLFTKPHYLGTDYLGRDLLARVMMGARVSLAIGFGAPLLYILIGIVYGSISGYFGGLIDDIMMRITDIVSTVPELLVVILLQVVLGSGVTTLIIAMVAVAWARSARQIRGEVLRLREMEFVHAAKTLGTSFHKIVFRHLLPNVMGTVLIVLTLSVPQAIFTEAFLSFIGLGIQPPNASWGTVTKEGARAFLTYPHELIIPSILICVTMLAFNLFGDGLRDALDPKLRGVK